MIPAMVFSASLFLMAVAATVLTLVLPQFATFIPAALLALGLSMFWFLRVVWEPKRQAKRRAKNWLVVDGSNVMFWQDNTPKIETLAAVVTQLDAEGFDSFVVFDANVGYKIGNKYQRSATLARYLSLPAEQVVVVQKGAPADPAILAAARQVGARIVTNDRYRDWVADHPEITETGHLIKGGYRDGKLWLAPH